MKRLFAIITLALSVALFALPVGCAKEKAEPENGNRYYSFTLSSTSFEMEKGDTDKLVAAYGNKKVTFSSSDETVVKVDKNGKLTAVGAGTATIYVRAAGKEKTATVTVNEYVWTVKIVGGEKDIRAKAPFADEIYAEVYRDGVKTDKKVEWKFSKGLTTVVSANSVVVRCDAAGEYTVTAAYKSAKASFKITVIE